MKLMIQVVAVALAAVFAVACQNERNDSSSKDIESVAPVSAVVFDFTSFYGEFQPIDLAGATLRIEGTVSSSDPAFLLKVRVAGESQNREIGLKANQPVCAAQGDVQVCSFASIADANGHREVTMRFEKRANENAKVIEIVWKDEVIGREKIKTVSWTDDAVRPSGCDLAAGDCSF